MLDFNNAVFHDGPNVTCRRGLKWADVELGQRVPITDQGETTNFEAVIGDMWLGDIDTVPSDWLAEEHDPDCRDRDGLLSEMRSAYGPDVDGTTTCVFLRFFVEEV